MIKWKTSYTVHEFYYGYAVILACINEDEEGNLVFDLLVKTNPKRGLCHHVSGLLIDDLQDEYNEETLEDRVRELAANGYFDDIIIGVLKDERKLDEIFNEEFFNEKKSDIE